MNQLPTMMRETILTVVDGKPFLYGMTLDAAKSLVPHAVAPASGLRFPPVLRTWRYRLTRADALQESQRSSGRSQI